MARIPILLIYIRAEVFLLLLLRVSTRSALKKRNKIREIGKL